MRGINAEVFIFVLFSVVFSRGHAVENASVLLDSVARSGHNFTAALKLPPPLVGLRRLPSDAQLIQDLQDREASDEARIAGLRAANKQLEDKLQTIHVEVDREFEGHDPQAHDHSRDYRKGHHSSHFEGMLEEVGAPVDASARAPAGGLHPSTVGHAHGLLQLALVLVGIMLFFLAAAALVVGLMKLFAHVLISSSKLQDHHMVQNLLEEEVEQRDLPVASTLESPGSCKGPCTSSSCSSTRSSSCGSADGRADGGTDCAGSEGGGGASEVRWANVLPWAEGSGRHAAGPEPPAAAAAASSLSAGAGAAPHLGPRVFGAAMCDP